MERCGGLVQASAAAIASDASGGSGGDWHDLIGRPGGGLAAVVGDVTGYGQRAARCRQRVQAALRRSVLDGIGDTDVLPTLRDTVRLPQDGFVTVVYVAIDPLARSVTVANAGHLPPLMVEPHGQAWFVSDDRLQPPVGAPASSHQEVSTIECERGSTMVLYTDGLVESPPEDINHGLARLAETVHHHVDLAPDELCAALLDAGGGRVARGGGERGAGDDRTALVVRLAPAR